MSTNSPETEDKQEIVADDIMSDDTAPAASTEEAPAENSNKPTETSEDSEEFSFGDEQTEEKEESATDENEKEEEESEESPASKFDKDLDTWAVDKGYETPENDKERKMLQDLRNNDRDFHASKAAKKTADEFEKTAKELGKPDKNFDKIEDKVERKIAELDANVRSEREQRLQSEFLMDNKVSEATGKIMTDILKEKVGRANTPEAQLRALDYWSSPDQLPDLLEIARSREINVEGKEEIERKAAQKERQRIEKEGQAGGQKPSAKSVQPAKKVDITDPDPLWDMKD